MKAGDKVRAEKVWGKDLSYYNVVFTGKLGMEVVKGNYLSVDGEPMGGILTSPIQLITYDGDKKVYVHTMNSTWRVEKVE